MGDDKRGSPHVWKGAIELAGVVWEDSKASNLARERIGITLGVLVSNSEKNQQTLSNRAAWVYLSPRDALDDSPHSSSGRPIITARLRPVRFAS